MSTRTPPLPTLENAPLRDLRPVRFSAIVKAPLNGAQYEFNGSQKLDFRPTGKVSSEAVYVFESLTIQGCVPQDEWVANVDDNLWPVVNLWSKISGLSPCPSAGIPVVCFTDHASFRFAWEPGGDPDTLQVSVAGKVSQSVWMVGKGLQSLSLAIVLTAYEISNVLWRNEYAKGWQGSWVGEELGEGGRSVQLIEKNGPTTILRERNF